MQYGGRRLKLPIKHKDGSRVNHELEGFQFTVTFCGQGNGKQDYLIWKIAGEWPEAEKLAKYLDSASFGGRYTDYNQGETERLLVVYID